jgi:acyl-CoA thioester hydrolase
VKEPSARSRVRVRYAETDKMGVVYHSNYFVWFEIARTDLLRGTGWTYRDMEAEGYGLPVIEARCEYLKPARYDDDLDIEATARLMSAVRVRFDYTVLRAEDAVRIATGHTVHAALDRSGRPCRLPARVQAALDARVEPPS